MKKYLVILLFVLYIIVCLGCVESPEKKDFTDDAARRAKQQLEYIDETFKDLGIVNVDSLKSLIANLQLRDTSKMNVELQRLKAELAQWNRFRDTVQSLFDEMVKYKSGERRNFIVNELKSICAQAGIELPEELIRVDANKSVPIADYTYAMNQKDSIINGLKNDSLSMHSEIVSKDNIIAQKDEEIRRLDSLYHDAVNKLNNERRENARLQAQITALSQEIDSLSKQLKKSNKDKAEYERKLRELQNIQSEKQQSDKKADSLMTVSKQQYIRTIVRNIHLKGDTRRKAKRIKALKIDFLLNADSEFYSNLTIELYFRVTKGEASGPLIAYNGDFSYEGKIIGYTCKQVFNFVYGTYYTSSIELKEKLEEGVYQIDAFALIDGQMEKVGFDTEFVNRKFNQQFDE